MKKIKIIALIGEAGAGKDWVLHQLFQRHPRTARNWKEVVSCTTRAKRENELDGVNYNFLTEEDFFNQIKNGDFIEYCVFNGWFYGTRVQDLDPNKINIGVFNPAGIEKLLQIQQIDLTVFWIYADPKIRLLRQLNREENPNVDEIIRRYNTDKEDFEKMIKSEWFPLEKEKEKIYMVVNNDNNNPCEAILDILKQMNYNET